LIAGFIAGKNTKSGKMNNKSNKNKQKITPASHGDELDVLEALYSIEEKSEKKLLTDDQRKALILSGRTEQPKLGKHDNIQKVIDMVILGLEQRALVGARERAGEEFWGTLTDIDKKRLIFNYFTIYFGTTPSSVKSSLQNIYMENI